MRRLLPTFLYPGRRRVGKQLAEMRYSSHVDVFDGVDWFWLPSIVRAVAFLRARKPDIVVLQWWTGTVAHSYLVLAWVCRRMGSRLLIEFHEGQDSAEQRILLASWYGDRVLRWLIGSAAGFLAHSRHDVAELSDRFDIPEERFDVVAHGPFQQHRAERVPAEEGVCRLLFFGTIRPYKGLEHLVEAFNRLSREEVSRYRLTVVGETWEGWTEPIKLIEESPYRDRIVLVNSYVADADVTGYFAAADVVVLPYLRSSASGPLHIAMSSGLPVVVTAVGGLVEATADYTGAVLVEPGRPDQLQEALRTARTLMGRVHDDPHSWQPNVDAILAGARNPVG